MDVAVDPLSLLKALSSMLNETGGVGGLEEMGKITRLMNDCEKLVSRCVYLNILRVTDDINALQRFLTDGGWRIMNEWLTEAKNSENMALVLEVMKILQRLPLRINHLKENNTPKLIKAFVKTSSCPKVKNMAGVLMNKWLTIIKDSSTSSNTQEPKKKREHAKSKMKSDKHAKNGNEKSKKSMPVVKNPSCAKFRQTGLESSSEPSRSGSKSDKKTTSLKRNSMESEDVLVPDKKLKPAQHQKKISMSAGFMDALNSVPTVPAAKRLVKRKVTPKTRMSSGTAQKSAKGEAGDFGAGTSEGHRDAEAVTGDLMFGSSSTATDAAPLSPPKPKLNKYGNPMKKVRWVEDSRLESVRYFQCEEGERVNVTTQSFRDAMQRERLSERQKVGGLHYKADDEWKHPRRIDLPPPIVKVGCNSVEKQIQSEREKTVLQEIFLSIEMVPDSPAEPDPEPYDVIPPKIIPIDDPNDQEPASPAEDHGVGNPGYTGHIQSSLSNADMHVVSPTAVSSAGNNHRVGSGNSEANENLNPGVNNVAQQQQLPPNSAPFRYPQPLPDATMSNAMDPGASYHHGYHPVGFYPNAPPPMMMAMPPQPPPHDWPASSAPFGMDWNPSMRPPGAPLLPHPPPPRFNNMPRPERGSWRPRKSWRGNSKSGEDYRSSRNWRGEHRR